MLGNMGGDTNGQVNSQRAVPPAPIGHIRRDKTRWEWEDDSTDAASARREAQTRPLNDQTRWEWVESVTQLDLHLSKRKGRIKALPRGFELQSNYTILSTVNRGTFTITYRAIDVHAQRTRIVKELHPRHYAVRGSSGQTIVDCSDIARTQLRNHFYNEIKFFCLPLTSRH